MGLIIPATEIPKMWPEAEILREPLSFAKEPSLLVRRRLVDIEGPNGEELIFLPGRPAISLFTGCGGIDIGLERTGFVTVCQHEWNEAACQTLIANRPEYFRHSALIQGDIRLTPTSMILKEAGFEVGEVTLVCGGPPCQGFSTANNKAARGEYDLRNDLVFEYMRVVREAKPQFFFFENVMGFVSFNKNEYLKLFLKTAYESYYDLVYGILDCADFCVPQRRIRFICMGTRRDISESKGYLASLPSPQTFGAADLKIIRKADKVPELQERARQIMRAPGIRYFADREVLIPPNPRGEEGKPENYCKFYNELEKNEPDRLVQNPRGPQ